MDMVDEPTHALTSRFCTRVFKQFTMPKFSHRLFVMFHSHNLHPALPFKYQMDPIDDLQPSTSTTSSPAASSNSAADAPGEGSSNTYPHGSGPQQYGRNVRGSAFDSGASTSTHGALGPTSAHRAHGAAAAQSAAALDAVRSESPADTRTGSMATSKDDEDSSNAASSDCKSPGQRYVNCEVRVLGARCSVGSMGWWLAAERRAPSGKCVPGLCEFMCKCYFYRNFLCSKLIHINVTHFRVAVWLWWSMGLCKFFMIFSSKCTPPER